MIYRERTSKPIITFNADDVWAAACAAQRVNGEYIKCTLAGTKLETNREIFDRLLGNPAEFIKDEDREMGQKVRAYYQAFTFKILKGQALSDFDNNAMLIANRDTLGSNFELATIVCLPANYERSTKRDNVNQRIAFASGKLLGNIGDKMVVDNVEVVRSVFSQKWNTHYITCITPEDSVVFFAFKQALDVGSRVSIGGTVKAHRDGQTQLNRVKVY